MKNSKAAVALGAAMLAGGVTAPSVALAELSANIGVTSNYVWRGATQTQNGPAIQGGVDWEGESGLYIGTWVSNVDFGTIIDVEDAEGLDDLSLLSVRSGSEYEADFYIGWGFDFNEHVALDVGYVYYHYGLIESGFDFGEVYANASFLWFDVGVYYTINDQADGEAEDVSPFVAGDLNFYGAAAFEIIESWSLGLLLGHYKFTNDGAFMDADYDYSYGQIDLTKSAGDFGDVTLSVSAADNENADGNDNTKLFISWVKSF